MNPQDVNPIVAENQLPGTLEWLPKRLRFEPDGTRGQTLRPDGVTWLDTGRSTAIEGYCSQTSFAAGEVLTVHVSTNPATDFTLDIYRIGYYGGHGARLIKSFGPITGTTQEDPVPGEARLVECDWTPSIEITVPTDWLSGVYLGKLTRVDDLTENYVLFVVRDERRADLVVQCSDFTWQAYNRWPNQYSLYSNGTDNLSAYYGTDVAASYDRPYLASTHFVPAIPGTGEYFVFEYPFTYWLESMGYDATYCSNVDTHRGTAYPGRAKGFLSVGHDEYWTLSTYENVRAARDAGTSLGFFSGNTCCFEIDFRASTKGGPERVISRKDIFHEITEADIEQFMSEEAQAEGDGSVAGFTDEYPFPFEAPDDGALMGARNAWPIEGCGDWICSVPDHWVFEGTGMAEGDSIPNLVGHEWHGDPADIPGLEVVSRGPTLESIGPGEYTATVYPGPVGNIVFNAATCWWGSGLALPPGYNRPSWQGMPCAMPDGRVQQITQNVLDRMIATGTRSSDAATG